MLLLVSAKLCFQVLDAEPVHHLLPTEILTVRSHPIHLYHDPWLQAQIENEETLSEVT